MAVVVRQIGSGLRQRVVPPSMVDSDQVEMTGRLLVVGVVHFHGVGVAEVPLEVSQVGAPSLKNSPPFGLFCQDSMLPGKVRRVAFSSRIAVMETETLGGRLRSKRKALGLTLADVAEVAGLSVPYVSNLERGRGNPTVDALTALAGALETNIADLLAGRGELEDDELLELHLAEAPQSLTAFSRSDRFKSQVERFAEQQDVAYEEMRRKVLIGMAAAPRRSAGDPVEDDWRRLLDAYSLWLGEP